jgi:hypothetical protein
VLGKDAVGGSMRRGSSSGGDAYGDAGYRYEAWRPVGELVLCLDCGDQEIQAGLVVSVAQRRESWLLDVGRR